MSRFLLLLFTVLGLSSIGHAAVVLSVDCNDALDSPTDTASGFLNYRLGDETVRSGLFTVDINPAQGAQLDDVHRNTPGTTGTLTLGALYRDAIFAAGDATANFYRVGLDAEIGGLIPGKAYTITAWSYDSGTLAATASDWSVVGLGGPNWVANNFTFTGAVTPANDQANRFSVLARADDNGRLVLRGRPAVALATPQVFLNGFTLDEASTPPVTATPVLSLEFNDRANTGAAYTTEGFTEFLLTGNDGTQLTNPVVRVVGAQTITLGAVGGVMDDRSRALPVNQGAYTEEKIHRDFIFNTTGGLDVLISGLPASTSVLVEVWSFDQISGTTVRTSSWTVNGGNLWVDYGFNGSNLPVTNEDYKMAGVFTTDASGRLLIRGQVVANAPSIFLNALRVSTLAPAPVADLGRPILSEFLADNTSGIEDEDGDSSDWIEVFNASNAPLDLAGWHLTDQASASTKWTFPAGVVLPAQGFLRVWASGKNRLTDPTSLHTNFTLKKEAGAYLALVRPNGVTRTAEFTYLPAQRAKVSYGLYGKSDPLTPGYFLKPTPRAYNSVAPVPGFVSDTTFSKKRGFYSAPFATVVSCATPGAVIRHTLDGSEPTASSPVVPVTGVTVSTTTVLRVKAFAPPLAPSNVDTQTYIFPAHVANQPAAPVGWPLTWGTDTEVNNNDGEGNGTVPADYEMDPIVTAGALPGYTVSQSLGALPTLSVVMAPADFHSAGTGIYTHPQSRGDAWERVCSLEYLDPLADGFHTLAGVRIHGTSSRRPYRMQKHSFRLAFRSTLGDGKLNYPLFDTTKVEEFDRLVLRACFTDSWGLVSWDQPRYRPDDSVYFRDVWVKRSFAAMGYLASSGRFAHIYINGLYWGIYELSERVDAEFLASHLGGSETDYDLLGDFIEVDAGSNAAWLSLFTFLNAGTTDLTQPAHYANVLSQVDMVNFVDYYLLHIHADAEDWPHKNGYVYRARAGADTRWKFIAWDQEIVLDPLTLVDRLSAGATNTTTNQTAGWLYQKLRVNPEFRLLFADRAHRHLHHGGALSLSVEQARWQALADQLDLGIVAESARWGDTADATPYGNAVPVGTVFTRENHWLPTVASVKNTHLPGLHNEANAYATITELRAAGLYPNTLPPEFSQFGGQVPVGFTLTMTAPQGVIYYTLNGSDPRVAYTGAVAGTTYAAPVALTQTCVVKARVLQGGEWSALTEATFVVGTAAAAGHLAVTELNYNPVVADEEFLELANLSSGPVDLTGVYFEGITFTFPAGTLLAPGERLVVVRNQAAFVARYGATPRIGGVYTGALDNMGEQITVFAMNGAKLIRFTYGDRAPWPNAPDGGGRSLTLRQPGLDPEVPAHWRSSVALGGSPGTSDSSPPLAGAPLGDADHDGYAAMLEHALNTSDTQAASRPAPVSALENLTVNGVPGMYLTITAPVNPGADDVTLSAQWSDTLGDWFPAPPVEETVAGNGSFSRKWRTPLPMTPGAPRVFLRLKASTP